jgi:hypothetical protein
MNLKQTTCLSVQSPDAGAFRYLVMLVQSTLPDKR